MPDIVSSHMSVTFPDAIQFKTHHFQSVSGPQEYMVEVPPLIQPCHLHSGEYPRVFDVNLCVHGGFWDKWCPMNGPIFPAGFYAQLLKMTEAFFPFLFCLCYFYFLIFF